MIPSFTQRITKRLVLAVAVPIGMLAMFSLTSDAQEKDKEPKEMPTARGLYREFSGVIQLGNYGDKPQKTNPLRYTLNVEGQTGIESMDDYFKAQEAPHIMGGSVYFAVFRNVGGGFGDAFGTGMPGGLDQHFVPGDGDPRPGAGRAGYASPRLDTSAKYLFLFQVVASRGLDSRNQLTDVKVDLISNAIKLIIGAEQEKKIKNAVGEEKTKLLAEQKNAVTALAAAVNKAMMPDAACEDVHRFSLQLNVNPTHITSWGYFENAGFAVNVKGTKEYVDRWGHTHKTVADGGVIPNDLVEDRVQAVSFLPRVSELVKDVEFERVKRAAYAMGVMEGSFHVDDANVGIEKSLPYRFAQGLVDRGEDIKFASHLQAGKKKADFAVKPYRVRIVGSDERPFDWPADFVDDDYTTSAFIVDFDDKGAQPRANDKEIRGIPRSKHSMVFGFTTNLEPIQTRRLRLDDLESTDRNKDLPFNEFFSEKVTRKVPARGGYSRGFDYWNGKKVMGGQIRGREFAFLNTFNPLIASDASSPMEFVLQQGGGAGGGGAGAGGGGAGALSNTALGVSPPPPTGGGGISGGMSSGLGSQSGGGGGGGVPALGGGPGVSRGGGFGGGGGIGSGNGTPTQAQQGTQGQQGSQQGAQSQTINFNASLINQQAQAQQQQQFQIQAQLQFQNQHQNNHTPRPPHPPHPPHPVVPAPASALLALLGLPALLWFRRKKAETPQTSVA